MQTVSPAFHADGRSSARSGPLTWFYEKCDAFALTLTRRDLRVLINAALFRAPSDRLRAPFSLPYEKNDAVPRHYQHVQDVPSLWTGANRRLGCSFASVPRHIDRKVTQPAASVMDYDSPHGADAVHWLTATLFQLDNGSNSFVSRKPRLCSADSAALKVARSWFSVDELDVYQLLLYERANEWNAKIWICENLRGMKALAGN